MTILVGVKCHDGVVIGADSIATSAAGLHPLVQITSNDKLQTVGNHGLVAATGSVGLAQRLKAILDKHWSDRTHSKTAVEYMNAVSAAMVQDCQNTGVPRTAQGGLGFGSLVAMIISNKPVLFEFGVTDFQGEQKHGRLFSVSIGSGQILADPFLAFVSRVLWHDKEPSVEMAKIGVYWVLSHTIQYAPGGVGHPIKLGVLRHDGKNWLNEILDDTQEQEQFIKDIESRIDPSSIVENAPTTPIPKL